VKEKLVLHVCCAPCAVYPVLELSQQFDLIMAFYGPCIYPEEEYNRRLDAGFDLSKKTGIKFIELEYNPQDWYLTISGLESESEGGKRCIVCYKMRLEKIAGFAKDNNCKYFATTLTISPHKPAETINPIGEDIARKYGIAFLVKDFKEKDGFKKGCQLTKEYGLYRQNYCGCEFSIRKTEV